jgi:hypothetical protein
MPGALLFSRAWFTCKGHLHSTVCLSQTSRPFHKVTKSIALQSQTDYRLSMVRSYGNGTRSWTWAVLKWSVVQNSMFSKELGIFEFYKIMTLNADFIKVMIHNNSFWRRWKKHCFLKGIARTQILMQHSTLLP